MRKEGLEIDTKLLSLIYSTSVGKINNINTYKRISYTGKLLKRTKEKGVVLLF